MSKRKSGRMSAAAEAKKIKEQSPLWFDANWTWSEPGSKKVERLVNFKADAGALSPVIQLTGSGIPGSKKIAAFDIDSTVIKTHSGRRFAIGSNDWQFWEDEVPDKLKEAHNDGYKIVFFTNQAGIEKNHVRPKEICTKCEDIIVALGFPVQVFMCTGQNQFRKPSVLVFDHMEKNCNDGIAVDRKKSYYVGDAAGRDKDWAPGKTRDFSCSDRMFAANCGLTFYTPEEYFLGEAAVPFQWRSTDPVVELKMAEGKAPEKYHSLEQEMIVMVGFPASGKSTFSRNYLVPHGYQVVNRDTLGTQSKCKKSCDESLKNGKSVIIDNTNPAKHVRQEYINIAKKHGVPIRCFWFQTSLPLAHHMNLYRQTQTNGDVRRVPDVGYNVFKKHFEEPDLEEGFSE
uniref:Bifunctional polynucleotide phosphatase/kinase-like n=1 Tax=Saccoglossus kowalevskii TaxID=10224 RepID=A0ABM0MWD8_SACKO